MKALCIYCKLETNHKVLSETIKNFVDNEEGYHATTKWQIIECNGCESVSFRRVEESSENFDHNAGKYFEDIDLYPQRSLNLLHIKSFYATPITVRRIYRETIDTYNNQSLLLCGAGLRAIIEAICKEKNIKDGPVPEKNNKNKVVRKKDLRGKIAGLYEKGLLTKKHSEILHEHRFLGNEVLHELATPSQEELRLAIEIMEHTIENIYEIEEKAEDLKAEMKRRRSKKS